MRLIEKSVFNPDRSELELYCDIHVVSCNSRKTVCYHWSFTRCPLLLTQASGLIEAKYFSRFKMILFSILLVSISGNNFELALNTNIQEVQDTFAVHDKINQGMSFTKAAKSELFSGVEYLNLLSEIVSKST